MSTPLVFRCLEKVTAMGSVDKLEPIREGQAVATIKAKLTTTFCFHRQAIRSIIPPSPTRAGSERNENRTEAGTEWPGEGEICACTQVPSVVEL